MLIDTHCHLDFPEFKDDLENVLKRALEKDVAYIINVASSIEGCIKGANISSRTASVFFTLGVHPHHAGEVSQDDLNMVNTRFGTDKKAVAIGEVGLDFYRDLSPREAQRTLFLYFLELKKQKNLPIIIHSRNAASETLDILKSELNPPVDGVMHCFSQDAAYMRKVLDLGLHVSFTCNITFKNASRLRDVAKYVPIDRLLLETDAPFLAPQQFRGKRNEPSYLVYLVETLSDILRIPEEDIGRITTKNANKLFRLGIEGL